MQTYKDIETFFEERGQFGIQPGLERMDILLRKLGHPERKVKGIHIAGTNGKGSTAQFLQAELTHLGYVVGMFTSPSMTGRNGHILHQNKPIGEETFKQLFLDVLPIVKKMDEQKLYPSEFEIITAMAFVYFSHHTDIAVIEAGMGGKEDATNCFHPLLSVITTVDFDHTAFLGDTLEEIAAHKAGILKEGVPAVIGNIPEAAQQVVDQKAIEIAAPIYEYGKDFHLQDDEKRFHFKGEYFPLPIKMRAKHQMHNASLAAIGLLVLEEGEHIQSVDHRFRSFSTVVFTGRFEKISDQPAIIADGAHNPAGIDAFIQTAHAVYPDRKKEVLFAAFRDKAIERMLPALEQNFDQVTVTTFDHPRAAQIEAYGPDVQTETDWARMVAQWKENKEAVYFVVGSLHFIKAYRKWLDR